MITGRVIGDIDSTINHPFYDGKKLLVVEVIDENSNATNAYLVAVDTVDAGVGDRVLVLDEGNGSRQIFQSSDAPVRSTIVGIIDEITLAT
jgi:microcompartment protein CcmK/EutM